MSSFDPEPSPVTNDSSQVVFDPYYEWLSIPPEEQPPNHYCLLGIKLYEDNSDVISSATDRQATHLHSFQLSKHAKEVEKLLSEVFKAKACLLDANRKIEYDQELKSKLAVTASSVMPSVVIRRARRRKRKSAPRETVKVILGGIVGSMLALLILWFVFGKDPLGVMTSNKSLLSKATSPRAIGDVTAKVVKRYKNRSGKTKEEMLIAQRKIDGKKAKNLNLEKELVIKPSEKVSGSSEWIDLLKMVDVEKHAVWGTWTRYGDEIRSGTVPNSRITIPGSFSGSYELSIDFTRHTGVECVSVVLPIRNTSCVFMLSGWQGRVHGISLVDGRLTDAFRENYECAKKFRINNAQRYRWDISVDIRGEYVTIDSRLDFKPLLSWFGKIDRLSCPKGWALPSSSTLGLGAYRNSSSFYRVELRSLKPNAN